MKRSLALAYALTLTAVATPAFAGSFGTQVGVPTDGRHCFDDSNFTSPPLPYWFRTNVDLGARRVLQREGVPWRFATSLGVGFHFVRFERRCGRATTGLFGGRERGVLGLGVAVAGDLVPAAITDSRVAAGLQVSFDTWTTGFFRAANPIRTLQLDVGPTYGDEGLGLRTRLGGSALFFGAGATYERLFEPGAHAVGIYADFANLHLLFVEHD